VFTTHVLRTSANTSGCITYHAVLHYLNTNISNNTTKKLNFVLCVHERTIPTERPPLVDEVSAIFEDSLCHVVSVTNPNGRILGFLDEPLLFLPSSSSVVLTRLSGPRSRPTSSLQNLVAPRFEPGPLDL
jgi:hypothetical protein